MHIIQWPLFFSAAVAVYWFLIRPWARQRPELKAFYDVVDARGMTVWEMVRVRLSGLKIQLVQGFLAISSLLIWANDFVLPIIGGAEFQPLLPLLPAIIRDNMAGITGALAVSTMLLRKYGSTTPAGIPDATIVDKDHDVGTVADQVAAKVDADKPAS